MEVEAPDGLSDRGILTGQFRTAQLEDPNLQDAMRQVNTVDGTQLPGVCKWRYPHFAIKHNLLYQVVKHNGETKDLLLITTQYISTVLQLAHIHLLGAHLGMEKTRERIGSTYTTGGHNHESSTRVKKVLVLIPTTESKLLARHRRAGRRCQL